MKIGIIGLGNMGGAIAHGLIKNESVINNNIYLYNRSYEKTKKFEPYNINMCESAQELIVNSEIIILAIKPNDYASWLEEHANLIQQKLLISIGASIDSSFLSKYTNLFCITMPNINVSISKGFTLVCENQKINSEINEIIVKETSKIFSYIGKVKIIKEEDLIKYTILSGSSPAFFLQILSDMSEAFETLGIKSIEASSILSYIMSSSSELVNEKNTPKELAQSVCSEKGVTIEAIKVFENSHMKDIFINALRKCEEKSEKMNNEIK